MNDKEKMFLEKFLEEKKIEGRMEKGIQNLKSNVPKLFIWLRLLGLELQEVGVKDALSYQGWLIETGRLDGVKYQSSTILNFIKAAISFYDYLTTTGVVSSNPFKQIRKIRENKVLLRNILKEKQIETLLYTLSTFDREIGVKNRVTMYKVHVISELMYSSGLRISEVANLKISDIDFGKGVINVREGKGGYPRTAWLNDYAKDVLYIYINRLRDLTFSLWHENNSHLLFGTPWFSLEKLVNKTLKKVSISLDLGHFTSHGFRHALGYHLLRAGCNIRYIQEILGHKSLKNTEIYTKVDREDLKEVLDSFHPRKFKKV